MKITVKYNYLVLPVNTLATNKLLTFKQTNKTVYCLDIKIDNYNPNFYAYIDVSRFIGQILDISVNPQIKLDFRFADEIDIENLYREPMRPQIHFTAKNGWINDPNGLVYLDGTYHMFYQYNPAESNWGNMHWGHATSKDLVHWTEEKTALFPDERGMMFSGSAVLDEKNMLGKNTDEKKAVLLYYTTTNPFAQCMSYSTDCFENIQKYSDNPIIENIEEENRDPKVVFCDELECYIMALYLKDDIYCILKSDDLVSWRELQRLHLQGDDECPDIFPLTDSKGNRKWIFMGAHGRYLVGNFENGRFESEQEVISHQYGKSAYAAQSFSNLPDGRIVRIAWQRWGLPALGFSGQMGIPTDIFLCSLDGKYYIEAKPVKEITLLYSSTEIFERVNILPENHFFTKLDNAPYLFKINGISNAYGVTKLQIFGRTIILDFIKNEIILGNNTAPISVTSESCDITLIVDRCSIEIFCDNGKIYMSCLDQDTVCDLNLPFFEIMSDDETLIDKIEIHSLNSIWQ